MRTNVWLAHHWEPRKEMLVTVILSANWKASQKVTNFTVLNATNYTMTNDSVKLVTIINCYTIRVAYM